MTHLIFLEMSDSKLVQLDSYHHAHALSCSRQKYTICDSKEKDQIGSEMAWPDDEKAMYSKHIEGPKWVNCNDCKKYFYLSCVSSNTEQQVEARRWPFLCKFNQCRKEWEVRHSSSGISFQCRHNNSIAKIFCWKNIYHK